MNLSPVPIQKFFDNNGTPLVSGLLFTYVAGTSTKIATYTDSTGGTPNTNPIVLNFRGECALWIDPTKSYKFVLAPSTDTDPPGNSISTTDNITAGPAQQDNAAVDTGSVNNIALSIPQISSPVAFTRIVFKASNTNTGAATITINGGSAKSLLTQPLYALSGNEIQIGGIYEAIFDGAQWLLQSPSVDPTTLKTPLETSAAVTPVSVWFPPDGRQELNLFRLLTLNEQLDVMAGTRTIDVSAKLQQAINFLEGRSSAGAGGKITSNGGTLFIPGGTVYCGSTSIRVGGNVTLRGNQYEGTQLQWASGFTGNCMTLGPDQSGFYGYSGLYTMGTVVRDLGFQIPSTANAGILTTGIGQNSGLHNLRLHNIANTGISITDTFGNIGFTMSDIFIFGAAGVMSATSVGIHCAAQSVIEMSTVSVEGIADSANNRFKRAVEIVSGGHIIKNLHFEACQTGVDIDAATGEYAQLVAGLTNTGLICSGAPGIWIHSGFTGSLQAMNVVAGTGGIIVKNDNTGYSRSGPGVLPLYSSANTAADISILENAVVSEVQGIITYVSGGTMTPDVGVARSHYITVTTVNAFTIGAPTYNGAAMPASLRGKRLGIRIRNGGAGVMGAITWNAVFKMSAWTNPANNFARYIEFEWNSVSWEQVNPTGVDVTN